MQTKSTKSHSCCCFGHRKITPSKHLIAATKGILENLILNNGVDTFLFGSKSEFNDLCYALITQFKQTQYPHIQRVYVRAEFPFIRDDYKQYLLEKYEHTYYPARLEKAGRTVYIQRNYEMIDKSDFCVVYYEHTYSPAPENSSITRVSGTQYAYAYAKRKGLCVQNVFEMLSRE